MKSNLTLKLHVSDVYSLSIILYYDLEQVFLAI